MDVPTSGVTGSGDQLDGTPLWTWTPVTGQLQGNVIVTETHAVVHSAAMTYLVDLATQQDVWSWPASGEVTLGESNLYIAQTDGTLTGTGFDGGGNTQVLFGGVPATEVFVVDAQTITCRPPVGAPGQVSVSVQNDVGAGFLAQAFSYLPAVSHGGLAEPGETLEVSIGIAPQETLFVLIGPDVQAGISTAPWFGTLQLVDPQLLVAAPFWPFDEFSFSLALPCNLNLSGVQSSVQALVGDMTSGSGAWTNADTILIQ